MGSAVATSRNTAGSTSIGCATKQTKKISPLRRRWLKCGTTRAGEGEAFSKQRCDEGYEHRVGHRHHLVSGRSADIALLAGGNRKRWIIATENMQPGDIIKTSGVIGRMAGRNLQALGERLL